MRPYGQRFLYWSGHADVFHFFKVYLALDFIYIYVHAWTHKWLCVTWPANQTMFVLCLLPRPKKFAEIKSDMSKSYRKVFSTITSSFTVIGENTTSLLLYWYVFKKNELSYVYHLIVNIRLYVHEDRNL